MTSLIGRYALSGATIVIIILLFVTLTGHNSFSFQSLTITDVHLQNLKTVFVSIFLEALPFVLLGAVVSSFLHLYVSEERLRRLLPRNPLLAIVYACLLGIVLPICECGMIPIVRSLIRKGMPVYLGITYILAAPIINPVTYAATAMAFRAQPDMGWLRMGLAFAAAALIGLLLYMLLKSNPLKPDRLSAQPHHGLHAPAHEHIHTHDHVHEHSHEHTHNHLDEHTHHHHEPGRPKLLSLFTHASDELFEMGKYLIIGAFLTACIQTFVTRDELLTFSGGFIGAHAFMMGFAYIISLCSTSDAFVAATFAGTFPTSALLAFLVYGPMVDLKNTLMMLSVFKARFVLQLIALITVVVLILSLLASRFLS